MGNRGRLPSFICVPAGTHVFSHYSGFSAGGASVQRGFNFFDAGGHIPFQFVDPETQNSPSGGRDLRIAPVVVEFSVTGEGGRQSERPRAVPDESARRRVRPRLRENARRRTQDSQHERSNRVRRQLRQRSVPAARMSLAGGSSSLARFYISPIRAVTRNRTALHSARQKIRRNHLPSCSRRSSRRVFP